MKLRLTGIRSMGENEVVVTFSTFLNPVESSFYLRDEKTFRLTKEEYDQFPALTINGVYDVELAIKKVVE